MQKKEHLNTGRVETHLAGFSYYEYKYLVRDGELSQVQDLLNHFVGGLDPYPEGVVDSIYYDTLDQVGYQQCVQGLAEKVKFRIRGYGDGSYRQLHIKKKNLCSVSKVKVGIIPVYDASPAGFTSISSLKPNAAQQREKMEYCLYIKNTFGTMIPSVRIRYYRYRFRYLDYRLTLDTYIEAFSVPGGIPRQKSETVLPHHVLEIKTKELRPTIPMMGLIKLPQISYSKFMLGIAQLDSES